ncbi:MAG: sigma-70 family RNA polymerase sigma factor [Myxococcota bacterium]
MESSDDATQLAAWRQGDDAAGRALFERYFDPLYRFFRNKAPNDVDDLVQDTFLSLVKNTVPFRGEASFRTYVFRVARSRLYDRARAWARRETVDVSVTSMADLRPSPSSILGDKQEEKLVTMALRTLSIEQQTLISLFYFEEMSGSELAEVMELPEGTVRSRLRLAKEALKTQVEALASSRALAESTANRLEVWLTEVRGVLSKR